MKKKGISPVLASIILLSVTVAVGVGVASYVFGLFGSYTETAVVKVQGSPSLDATNKEFNVTLLNTGAQADTVGSVSTVVNGTTYDGNIVSGAAINGGGGSADLYVTFSAATFTAGTSYQIRLSFNSGAQMTLTVTAAA
jgi:flagellin-like protein